MFRKYIVVNNFTSLLCFNGRRFWSINGATKAVITKLPHFVTFVSIRKIVK